VGSLITRNPIGLLRGQLCFFFNIKIAACTYRRQLGTAYQSRETQEHMAACCFDGTSLCTALYLACCTTFGRRCTYLALYLACCIGLGRSCTYLALYFILPPLVSLLPYAGGDTIQFHASSLVMRSGVPRSSSQNLSARPPAPRTDQRALAAQYALPRDTKHTSSTLLFRQCHEASVSASKPHWRRLNPHCGRNRQQGTVWTFASRI
jgi:hypothetical protein